METPTPQEKVRALDRADGFRGQFDLSDGWALKKLAAEVRDQDRKIAAMKDCIVTGLCLAAGWASYRNWEPAKQLATFASTDKAQGEFTEKAKIVLAKPAEERDFHRCKCGGRLIAPGECEDCGRNFE